MRVLFIGLFCSLILITNAAFGQYSGPWAKINDFSSYTPANPLFFNDSIRIAFPAEFDSLATPATYPVWGRGRIFSRGTLGMYFQSHTTIKQFAFIEDLAPISTTSGYWVKDSSGTLVNVVIANGKLLGNNSGSAATPQEITLGTNLSFSGSTLNASGGGGSGTVTHTSGALTNNAVVLGAGSDDTKVAAGITTDGTSIVTLGVAGTSVGGVDLKNSTSGTISIRPQTGALGTPTVTVPAANGTLAMTTPRVSTIASSSTPSPSASTDDMFTVTALAAAATFASPGTGAEGQWLVIRIKDNGTARALSWNAIYRASSDLALPTTTVVNKTLYLSFIYNNTDSKWDLLALLNNF